MKTRKLECLFCKVILGEHYKMRGNNMTSGLNKYKHAKCGTRLQVVGNDMVWTTPEAEIYTNHYGYEAFPQGADKRIVGWNHMVFAAKENSVLVEAMFENKEKSSQWETYGHADMIAKEEIMVVDIEEAFRSAYCWSQAVILAEIGQKVSSPSEVQ